MQRIRSRLCWKWDLWIFGNTVWECQRQHHISELNIIGTGKPVARLLQEIRRTSWRSEIVEYLQICWFLKEDWERTVLHHNGGRIWDYTDSLSRIHSITKPHNIPTERVDSFNAKIGPVLDVKLYPHEGRYCIDIMIESLFKDRTVSWVRIVKGINKYVTETSEDIPTENVELFISTGKLVAKAKPKPKSVVNSSINVPIRERKWIDILSITIRSQLFWSVNFHDQNTATWLLNSSRWRRSSKIWRLDRESKGKKVCTLQQTVKTWENSLAHGGWRKNLCQHCLNPCASNEFLYFRAIQGHSGESFVDPLLQDNILLPDDFAEYFYHIGKAYEGLIPERKSNRRDRQSVFFTAVNPMDNNQDLEEVQYDLDKPGIAPYKHTWRSHHNTRMQLLFQTYC